MMAAVAENVRQWTERLVAAGLVTATAARIWRRGGEEVAASCGLDAAGRTVSETSLFDLASLTKPFTATLAMVLDGSMELPLGTRLGEVWSGIDQRLAVVRLGDLLRHRAGFERWMPLYFLCKDEVEVVRRLVDGSWLLGSRSGGPRFDGSEPLSEGVEIYSDLDYMLWTATMERALDSDYWSLLEDRVLLPLGADAAARPDDSHRAVRCSLPTGREVALAAEVGLTIDEQPPPSPGEPQDGNCRFLGRPFGHAGVFAPASSMMALLREWIEPGRLLSQEQVESARAGEGRFALGWYRSPEAAAGRVLGPLALGHDGFTGGSVWLDIDSGLAVVALAHRSRLEVDLSPARVELVELALRL